jgi:hypothetical protein
LRSLSLPRPAPTRSQRIISSSIFSRLISRVGRAFIFDLGRTAIFLNPYRCVLVALTAALGGLDIFVVQFLLISKKRASAF